MKKLRRL